MGGLRTIHLADTFWKIFYSVIYSWGNKKQGYSRNFSSRWHGFLPNRRREGAILVQQRVGWTLRRLNIPHLNELHDLTNAFMCPHQDELRKLYPLMIREDLH
eukprot:8633848-Pyramimonas_sp.AAC.1